MTAITIEKMPQIIQIRKCENPAFKDYVFPDIELSEDLLAKSSGKGISASYVSTTENPKYEYNIPFKHNVSDSFHGAESAILPETFSVNDLLKETATMFPALEDNSEEIEEAFLRGIQPINHQHKVLFTQEIEIRTSELRRWRPNIVIDPILFDDDE